MKDYILEIGRKRAASSDEVTKNILKLSINSLYGKCLQDEQKQQNLTPYTVLDKFAKAACRVGSEFHIVTMEQDAFLGLTTTRHRKGRVLRAPRALGFTILEYSKAHMVFLHYKVMKVNYGDNLRLLMTDTDSLIYQIKCEHDVLEDFLNLPAYFDLSGSLQRLGDRSEDVIRRVKADKGLLGLLKPEEGDNVLVEYVGLCSKMYALRLQTLEGIEETVRKGKGVPSSVLKKNALFEHFKTMANAPFTSTVAFRGMSSKNHQVNVTEQRRKMLGCLNDKVFAVSRTESRPLGHFRNFQRGDAAA